jgi:prevent-host-death family protein
MKRVSVAEFKAKLSEILDAVIAGEDVMITRRGKTIAKIVASDLPKEKLDIDRMRALTSKMKPYPGSSVEDMRNEERY